jgi:type 1 glutamine amidotransferase
VARPKTLLIVGGPAEYHNKPEQYEGIAGLLVGPAGLNITVVDDFPGQTRDSLAGYDLLVLWSTWTRDVPVGATEALLETVRRGTPLLIMHGSLYNFRDNPAWVRDMGALIRSRPIAHLPYQDVTVEIQDRSHPITAGVGDFETADELFTLELQEGTHLVASFDGRKTELPFRDDVEASEVGAASHAWRKAQPRAALVYVKRLGEGWICGNALGHDGRALANAGFRQLTVQATSWLTRAANAA